MASTLVDSIDDALFNLDELFVHPHQPHLLKIELRNLKILLVMGSRKLGGAHFMNSSSTLPSLFSRIDAAVGRLCMLEVPDSIQTRHSYFSWLGGIGEEVNHLWEEAYQEWYSTLTAASTSGPLLTVDDVVAIADSILDNCHDFQLKGSSLGPRWIEVQKVDAFEEHIHFLRNLLAFCQQTGVPISNLLILIQPIVIDAARVFSSVVSNARSSIEWTDVLWKCATVNKMVTERRIYLACAKSLCPSTSGSQYVGMADNGDSLYVLIDFLNSLISYLWDVLRHLNSRHDQYIVLYPRLRSYRAILEKLYMRFHGKVEVSGIGKSIRDAALLILLLNPAKIERDIGRISYFLQRLDVIEAQIQKNLDIISAARMSSRFDQLQISEPSDMEIDDHSNSTNSSHGYEKDFIVRDETQFSSHQPSQVVGFQDDEVESILNRLTRGSNQLRVVPILGMAGIGKTTFALKLYNHRSIMYHFQARAWCSISQVLDKKTLLVQLLNQIHESDNYSEMTEDDLANSLRKSLKRKRYLILLDDVWTLEVWNSLQTSFPDDSTRSRILLTSRHSDAAPHGLLDGKPHSLRLREDHECLEILQMKLPCGEGWNPELATKMAKACKGLPLMTVIVAGILATVKLESWEVILYHLRSSGVSHEELCNTALELSFKHLPDDLKLCFLYMGAFPEDETVSVKRLIQLWMAEGFVKKKGSKTSGAIGRGYLDILVQRSLIMVDENRSTGGVKSCRIHDILHDFCRKKARQENIFHLLEAHQLSDFNQPHFRQRLSIHSTPIHFKRSKLFCPLAQSLLLFSRKSLRIDKYFFDMSFIIQIYKLLKVLDIRKFGCVAEIPSEIEFLSRLTYLSVQSHFEAIPYSIGNLSNLETLIAVWSDSSDEVINFPDTLWNLQNLKHLQIQQFTSGFCLSTENLESSSNMLELETLSGVEFSSDGSMEKLLKKFPNIRKLRCTLKFNKFVIPDFLNHLRSLSISGKGKLECEFGSTQNLRKVTLQDFELSREQTAVIGRLANLEVLKLFGISFSGGILEMEEGEFSKLKVFHITVWGAGLTRWTASDEQLPNLQKLSFECCELLEEIPSACLENIATLEEIRVRDSCSTLECSVRAIEAVQADFGNFVNVHISHYSTFWANHEGFEY